MKKAQKGFTLIELLVVVAIIAILALIVMLALNPVEMARRSRDSRRLSDLETLRKAVDLSLTDGKTLPGTTSAPVTTTTAAAAGADIFKADNTGSGNMVGMDISKYISTIPQDPGYENSTDTVQTSDGTNCTSATPGTASIQKDAMVYTFKSNGSTYELNAYLESTDNCKAVLGDGGNATGVYELGTKLNLL